MYTCCWYPHNTCNVYWLECICESCVNLINIKLQASIVTKTDKTTFYNVGMFWSDFDQKVTCIDICHAMREQNIKKTSILDCLPGSEV